MTDGILAALRGARGRVAGGGPRLAGGRLAQRLAGLRDAPPTGGAGAGVEPPGPLDLQELELVVFHVTHLQQGV